MTLPDLARLRQLAEQAKERCTQWTLHEQIAAVPEWLWDYLTELKPEQVLALLDRIEALEKQLQSRAQGSIDSVYRDNFRP